MVLNTMIFMFFDKKYVDEIPWSKRWKRLKSYTKSVSKSSINCMYHLIGTEKK